MRKSVVVLASVAAILACDEPVAPTLPVVSGPTRQAAVASASSNLLAWHRCEYWQTPDTPGYACFLQVSNADRTINTYAQYSNHPSWSPDGTKIVADDNSNLLLVNVSDGSVTQLNAGGGRNYSPAWSPDGARIAFMSDRTGYNELFVVNADGSNLVQVTNNIGNTYFGAPHWFPNGNRLVFDCAVDVDPWNFDLCAIDVDGSGFSRITTDPADDLGAVVSPDGTQIAFTTTRYSSAAAPGIDIAVMGIDGSNVVRLTALGYAQEPAWSPGGGRLAFTGPDQTQMCEFYGEAYCDDQIYIINSDGTGLMWFAAGAQAAWRPGPGDPPDLPPDAQITYSCDRLVCTFDSHASTDDRGILDYEWNLGDGGHTHQAHFWHSYASAGTYVVTLTVTDGSGQSATAKDTITVTTPDLPPTARVTAICAGLSCSFDSGTSSDDHGIVSRAWTFGDGSIAGNVVAPSHTYGVGGGTYTVTLTVTDGVGQSSSTTQTVTAVDRSPTATFTFSCASNSCTFDASASTDDVGITSYLWDFGKLGTASGSVVKLTVRGKQSFLAMLTVRDGAGQASSTSQSVTTK